MYRTLTVRDSVFAIDKQAVHTFIADVKQTNAYMIQTTPALFDEQDAWVVALNSWLVLSVPARNRYVNPYLEMAYVAESAYLQWLERFGNATHFSTQATASQKVWLAVLLTQKVNQYGAQHDPTLTNIMTTLREKLHGDLLKNDWANDAQFLHDQKIHSQKLLHFLNTGRMFERLFLETLHDIHYDVKQT